MSANGLFGGHFRVYTKDPRFHTVPMSDKVNEIQLVNAKIAFTIHPNCTPNSKSHFCVKVEFRPEFKTREEYLAFRKSWKNLYMRVAKGIRILRPVANFALQELPFTTYHHGRYLWPHHDVSRTLFCWRMQAKALLMALVIAKQIAGEQRNHACTRCHG